MKLNTREWGTGGDRIAVLVHGIMSDSRTWRRVGPALAEHDYHVVAVDLRGHGKSGRTEEYPPEAYGTDIIETVKSLGGVDLAVGHSLGAGAVLHAIEAGLGVSKAVYVEPGWRAKQPETGIDVTSFVDFADHATYESIAALRPQWDPEDVAIEVATLAVWDRRTALELPKHPRRDMPSRADVPSLLMLADDSQMVNAQDAETLRDRGFEVRTVPGAGHTIHRDDFDGFMAGLDGWI